MDGILCCSKAAPGVYGSCLMGLYIGHALFILTHIFETDLPRECFSGTGSPDNQQVLFWLFN